MTVRGKIQAVIVFLVLLILINTLTFHFQDSVAVSNVVGIVTASTAVAIGVLSIFYLNWTISIPIRRIIYNLKQSQNGELRASIKISGGDEFSLVAQRINDFTHNLHDTLVDIDNRMLDLLDHANHMTSTSLKSNLQAKNQQIGLGELLELATRLAESVREVSDNAEIASSSAGKASDLCGDSRQVIADSVTSVKDMAGDISQSLNHINELQQDCQGVTVVLDVISGIAGQTNLLALNAAIEAARAGEQGRGFAVVADEVRTLAHKTQESTGEIAKVISSLQARADSAVGYMTQVDDKSKSVVSESDSALQALTQITEKVAAITSMNRQIAVVAEEQEQMSKTIHHHVEKVNELSINTVNQTRDTQQTGQKTNQLAKDVQKVLSQFKLLEH